MKHSLASKIVVLLVPLLLLNFICPKAARGGVFECAAGRVVTVYRFVMAPLLGISMLVAEHIALPTAIAEQAKNNDNTGKKPSSSNDNSDYIVTASFYSAFIAGARKFVLSLAGLLSRLCGSASGQNCENQIEITIFFAAMPFIKQCILRSNPSLARGDPPAFLY